MVCKAAGRLCAIAAVLRRRHFPRAPLMDSKKIHSWTTRLNYDRRVDALLSAYSEIQLQMVV